MEHLLNIVLAVTLKRPTLGFPLFLTLSIARMKVNLGVKLTFSSVPTSLVANCNCLPPPRSIFSYVKRELQEFLCWRLFWRWTYKCWQMASLCLNTSNAPQEWVAPVAFEAQINIQILFWLTYVFWPCPFLNFTCVCLRTQQSTDFQTIVSFLQCEPKKDSLLNCINVLFLSLDFPTQDLKTLGRWWLCVKGWQIRKTRRWGWLIRWKLTSIQD